ncbi:MAG: carbohydrate ABC transporter permease [Gemmatimonadota bacterium]|jgi:ABC-type glycerol-3-phosphate transport system permease component|nr:carbohydrate ABC transporter permease [Gemmatimonadota bacterium]MDP6528303.1 carbohydrate ABC transporter permease [Gemmatimonadota bacterium]MDP6803504.1 carbohydrate ABC transporter permease [Gemmatimonadota bacterium]MDP7031837.1 carbohydrate ABC transporter permease [Gemmatimonadota bacterium]
MREGFRIGQRNWAVHVVLLAGAVSFLLPFYWMLSTALKGSAELFESPPTFFPHDVRPANFPDAWNSVPFPRYFFNTIFVALCIVAGVVVTSGLSAFAFAFLKFRGREGLFNSFLSTMMVPEPVYIISSYILLYNLPGGGRDGWINDYSALIVPWLAHVFSIFLLRQHFLSFPRDLVDAAVIDGCGPVTFIFRIILPLSRAALTTVCLFTFINTWNSFLWPLVMTNSDTIRPVQVGLAFFAQEQGTEHGLMMAAATFAVAPLLVAYFFAQKQIIESLTHTGLKG